MTLLPLTPPRRTLQSPDELVDALGIPFSDQQLAAITAPLEPGVIIAGAGSGKTTVMAARVVWLVGTGAVRPDQVLGLTFTRKAAAELSARIRSALAAAGVLPTDGVDEAGEQVVMTYAAFGARPVADHGLRLGFDGDPVMISGATRFRLASRVVNAAAGPFEHLARLRPPSITERVLQLDGDMAAHLVDAVLLDRHARLFGSALAAAPLNNRGATYASIKAARATAEERLELASLVEAYQALKRRHSVVEFADQMAFAARLATEVPSVSAALRAQFSVVLLDEYQDTSSAQARLLSGLFSGPSVAEGLGPAVTAVGAPSRAICGWRGPPASNILEFAEAFPRADGPARSFALTVNRRSGQRILDVANEIATPLRADPALRRLDGDEPQGLLVAPDGVPGGEVRAASFDTWPDEQAFVADQVVAAHTLGTVRAWSDVAVLLRRNADIAPLFARLTALDVPVEIAGLGGLLELPEVADVVATLRVLSDVTANPDVIRLLTGSRWAIGPADLALLGRRAAQLARAADTSGEDESDTLEAALRAAVGDLDVTEMISLADAVDDPGDLPYSPAARARFARFAHELTTLRSHADEPVLDLTRRVVSMLGLDVELAATPAFALTQRRAQLETFLDAVATYVDVDGEASLAGLLAYLQAELDQGNGLDQAVPSATDSVKLLTVHRAKGLEWDMVLLPALVEDVFPSDRVTDNWVKSAAVVRAPRRGDRAAYPQLPDVSDRGSSAYADALKAEQRKAEDRLAYVGVTRARRLLVASAHHWRAGTIKPRVPSSYFLHVLGEAERQGQVVALAEPPTGENPLLAEAGDATCPQPRDETARARRAEVAAAVAEYRSAPAPDPAVTLDLAETIAGWDADIEQLLAEARRGRRPVAEVSLPSALSASAVLAAHRDPDAYAAALVRPMPRPPRVGAQLGTLFHAWVEQRSLALGEHTQAFLIDPEDAPDETEDDVRAALSALRNAFERGPYAKAVPVAIEAPFSLPLGGQLVRGRIDAVYPGTGGARYQVVDWKTGQHEQADPLQLSLYRLAWAELSGVPLAQVDAVFCHVRSGRIERPTLLDRDEIAALLASVGGPRVSP